MAAHVYRILSEYATLHPEDKNTRDKLNHLEHALNYAPAGNCVQFDHYDLLIPMLKKEQDKQTLEYIQKYLIPFYCMMWVKLGCPKDYETWRWDVSQWTDDNYLDMLIEIRDWLDLADNI